MRTACRDDGDRYVGDPAIVLTEPEADLLRAALDDEQIVIGWSTLFETRMVLTGPPARPRDIGPSA